MKKIPILLLLLSAGLSFAQLNITNSSYMFVTGDHYVYVTDDINLRDAPSTIYLRDEAQILQGNNVQNSGIGELSVYQEGNVSEYEYNYWCSPIGTKTINSVNNPFGISLLNDVNTLTTSTPATFIHASDYNGTSSPLNIEPYWIWKYIASDEYSEWIHVQGASTINPGEGFTMKGTVGSGNNQRYDFRGKPNSGDIGVTVAAPIAGVPQQTLVGNPYPSAMDARDFIHDAGNVNAIDGTLFYWEQVAIGSHYIADYEGGYATYTINAAGTVETFVPAVFRTYDGAGNDTGPAGGTAGKTARRYIPIGQGFMVEGSVGSTGTVFARNNHRVFYRESGTNSEFFRQASEMTNRNMDEDTYEINYNDFGLAIMPENTMRFRVNVEFNDTYKRQLVQTFESSATDGFDYGLESLSPEGTESDAYWVLDEMKYVAQAFQFDEALRIPLVLDLHQQQNIGFSIFDIQNFDGTQPIFIHDKAIDLYVDLRNQNYTLNLAAGNYPNRFEITFTEESLDIEEVIATNLTVFQDNPNAQLTLINPNGSKVNQVALYDTAGKQIFRYVNLDAQSEYHFSTSNLSEGVYVATVEFGNQQSISKKIIIRN